MTRPRGASASTQVPLSVEAERAAPLASRAAPWRIGTAEADERRDVRVRERRYRIALATADMVAAAVSIPLAMTVAGGPGLRVSYVLVLPLVVIATKILGLYDRDDLVMRKSTTDEIPRLLNLATLFTLVIWLLRRYILRGPPHTDEWIALWVLLLSTTCALRVLARFIAARLSPPERCFLLGDEATYRRLKAKVQPLARVELLGFLPCQRMLVGDLTIADLARDRGIHRLIIAPGEAAGGGDTVDLVRAAKATGVRVSLLPGILGAVGSSVVFDDLGGLTLLGVPRFGLTRSSTVVKRAFDLAATSILLPTAAPLMALIACAIKLDGRGPVFFRQTRVGRDGRPFDMLKFRTMIDGADEIKSELAGLNEADGLFKIADDPRITRVGRWLRRSSLDELPQLINVFRGEMSIVGPRPLVIDDDQRITGLDRRRLYLTPGITGPWQILGSSRIPLSEMVKIDYLYVANWSLWTDLQILMRTIPVVLGRSNL